MNPKDLSIDDISVGDSVSFDRTWTDEDVRMFALLSKDMNPLHLDEKYARTTKFKQRVVHGMLVGSACSELVGMHLPGKRCLYLRQTLSFKKPVFIGDTVTVRGIVKTKSVSTGILEISILIKKRDDEVVDGTATVQVLA